MERTVTAWVARDWETVTALRAPGGRIEIRRSLMRLSMTVEEGVDDLRRLFDARGSRITATPLATRGEHLALGRIVIEGEVADGGGPFTTESLGLFEVDGECRLTVGMTFDPDDPEAALAELDARYQSSDPGLPSFYARFKARLGRRDWDAVAALYAPDHVGRDHRLVSWGTLRGPTEFLQSVQQLLALAPDAQMRTDHVRSSNRALLMHATWVGTREGGAFESPFVAVVEIDAAGLTRRSDFYDPEQIDRAIARYEEISAGAGRVPLTALSRPNLASALLERWGAACNARDEAAQLALVAPGFDWDDRRRHVQVRGGIEEMIATTRLRAEADARATVRILGTAGERVAIGQLHYVGGPADGPLEIEALMVGESDADGRAVATILFDADDRRNAQREAWARWAALEPELAAVAAPLGRLVDAFNAHDRAGYRAPLAEDVVVVDQRLAGMGRLEGADAWADSLVALWELAPESSVEAGWAWLAIDERCALTSVRRTGVLPEGGEFESEYLILYTVADGRIDHVGLWEVDAYDAALRRFEALRSETPRAPARTPRDLSNVATQSMERWQAAFDAGFASGDWTPMQTLCAPGFRFEDRRRLALLAGDAELMIASARERAATGARPGLTVIGTAGDRVVVERVLWSGGPSEGRFEIEYLAVAEVDAVGRLVHRPPLKDPENPCPTPVSSRPRMHAPFPVCCWRPS
jgi:ketosteroid isomerase-like protein